MATQSPLYTIGRDAVMQLTSLQGELLPYRRTVKFQHKFGVAEEDYKVTVDIPSTAYSMHVKNDKQYVSLSSTILPNATFFGWYSPDVGEQTYENWNYQNGQKWEGHIATAPEYFDPTYKVESIQSTLTVMMHNPAIPPEFDMDNPNFNWEEYEQWRQENPGIPERVPRPLHQITLWFHSAEGYEDEVDLEFDFLKNDNKATYWIDKPDEYDVKFEDLLKNLGPYMFNLPVTIDLSQENYNLPSVPSKYKVLLPVKPNSIFQVGKLVGFNQMNWEIQCDCRDSSFPQLLSDGCFTCTNNNPLFNGNTGPYFFINLPSVEKLPNIRREGYRYLYGVSFPYIFPANGGQGNGMDLQGDLLNLIVEAFFAEYPNDSSVRFLYAPYPSYAPYTELDMSSIRGLTYHPRSIIWFPKKLVQIPRDRLRLESIDSFKRLQKMFSPGWSEWDDGTYVYTEGKWKILDIPLWKDETVSGQSYLFSINDSANNQRDIITSAITFNYEKDYTVKSPLEIRIGSRKLDWANETDLVVKDAETYNLYKGKPYLITDENAIGYYPFTRKSIVDLFNSLPPVESGVSATIILDYYYRVDVAQNTDEGGWNSLTDEEIAIATTKGYTVTITNRSET